MILRIFHRMKRTDPDAARRGRGGFSMGEMMVTLIIISLLSMGIATGIAFAVRQYNRGLIRSESRILCSTLTSIFREEFGNTTCVDTGDGSLRYFSKNYTPEHAGSEDDRYLSSIHSVLYSDDGSSPAPDGYGQLVLRTQDESDTDIERPILPPEAYVPAHKLRVKAEVEYIEDLGQNGTFRVTLHVRGGNENVDQAESTFCVIPLNKPRTPGTAPPAGDDGE